MLLRGGRAAGRYGRCIYPLPLGVPARGEGSTGGGRHPEDDGSTTASAPPTVAHPSPLLGSAAPPRPGRLLPLPGAAPAASLPAESSASALRATPTTCTPSARSISRPPIVCRCARRTSRATVRRTPPLDAIA